MLFGALLLPLTCCFFQATPPARSTASVAAPELPLLQVTPLEFPNGLGGHFPMLSRDGQGRAHLCWLSSGGQPGETLLQHQTWDGTAWSPLSTLAQGASWLVNWADFAKYQQDSAGAAVLSWQAMRTTGGGYGVQFQQRPTATGVWGQAQSLHADQQGVEHGFVSFVPLGEGRFFANWLQSTADGPPTALRGVVLAADGHPEEEVLLDDRVCDCCGTDSVILPSGYALVAYRNRSAAEVRDIFVVRGKPGQAETWTKPMAVGMESWQTSSCPVNGPALTNEGSFVALAYYTEIAGRVPQVRYVVSRSGGKHFGFSQVLASGKKCLGRVSIALLPAGPAVVSWLQREGKQVFWVACAIPRQGKPGPLLKIAEVSGARSDGFLQLLTSPGGVLAAWTGAGGKAVQVAQITLLP